jgi:sugar/nucleoside kinase (ribokinase family)
LSIWSSKKEIAEMPAFTSQVMDRIGAGDALYAVVSLLLKVGAPLNAVGLFGNLAGASMVSEIGNRNSLDTVSLKRHARIALK